MNYCYMEKETNRLVTNFVASSIVNISKRNITKSNKILNLVPTLEKLKKWHMQIDLEK